MLRSRHDNALHNYCTKKLKPKASQWTCELYKPTQSDIHVQSLNFSNNKKFLPRCLKNICSLNLYHCREIAIAEVKCVQNYIRYNSGYSYPLRKSRVVKHILVHQASYKVKYTKLELMSETNFASFLHSTKRPIQGSCHSSLIGYWGKISRSQACCYLIVQQCFLWKPFKEGIRDMNMVWSSLLFGAVPTYVIVSNTGCAIYLRTERWCWAQQNISHKTRHIFTKFCEVLLLRFISSITQWICHRQQWAIQFDFAIGCMHGSRDL